MQASDSSFQIKDLPYQENVESVDLVPKNANFGVYYADHQPESLYDSKDDKPADFLGHSRPQLMLNEPRGMAPALAERRPLPQFHIPPPLQTEFMPPGATKMNFREKQLDEPTRSYNFQHGGPLPAHFMIQPRFNQRQLQTQDEKAALVQNLMAAEGKPQASF